MATSWDPDHPGCAAETCGGTSYDPCVTVMRTRGRWHDHTVPETAVAAIAAEALLHISDSHTMACSAPGCGHQLTSLHDWAEHTNRARVAAVADWVRAQLQVPLRNHAIHTTANAWAARLLDPSPDGA